MIRYDTLDMIYDTQYYQLINKNYPNGTITWTEKKYGDFSHYIQVDSNPDNRENYGIGEKWYFDSLFEFEQEEIFLMGNIQDFSFVTPSNVTYLDEVNHTLTNPTSVEFNHVIQQSFERVVNVSYKFDKLRYQPNLVKIVIENVLSSNFGGENETVTVPIEVGNSLQLYELEGITQELERLKGEIFDNWGLLNYAGNVCPGRKKSKYPATEVEITTPR